MHQFRKLYVSGLHEPVHGHGISVLLPVVHHITMFGPHFALGGRPYSNLLRCWRFEYENLTWKKGRIVDKKAYFRYLIFGGSESNLN